MWKLKIQYFGHLMWRASSLAQTPMLGKTEDRRKSGWQRMRWLDGIPDSMDICLSKLKQREFVPRKDRETWHTAVHVISKSQTGLSDWTTTTRRAGIPQAKQLARWEHSPTHQQTSSLKTYWAHSYLKPHPFAWSFTSEEIDPASPTRGQESPTSLKKSLDQPHSWGGRHQKQEELQSHSLQKGDHEHRKLNKMKQQRNILQMKLQNKTHKKN